MRNGENVLPNQSVGFEGARSNFEWILDETETLDRFINKIQGKKFVFDEESKMFVWIDDADGIKFVNKKGANFIRTYLETLLSKGSMTSVLDNEDINFECKKTARDMRHTFIHESTNYELDNIYIRPLKNMVVRFALVSLRKSMKAKMLDVIKETTEQKVSTTNINRDEGTQEKKGLFGGLFK